MSCLPYRSHRSKRTSRLHRGVRRGRAATRRIFTLLVAAFAGVAAANAGQTNEQLLLAVASNFAEPARSLADRFATDTGIAVRISTASTGTLYAQIVNGAPFDVLLAADAERPALLESAGKALPDSRRTYAVGQLVLWYPSAADSQCARPPESDELRRIAMANPSTAPYGMAAQQTLETLGIRAALNGRIVFGENVAQAFQFAATRNVTAAFVARAQIDDGLLERSGCVWEVPSNLHAPIEQQAVGIAGAGDGARRFLAFLDSDVARRIIADHGYLNGDD